MDHQRRVHLGVFQQSCFDHVVRALKNLLGGLEHQLDGTLDLVLMLFQQPGGPQQHGGVQVVTAGVHPAVRTGKIHAGLLPNGQTVHVRPQQEHLPRLFAAHQCHQTCPTALHRSESHARQFAFDEGQRLLQLESRLRVPVQLPPLLQNALTQRLRLPEQSFRCHIHNLPIAVKRGHLRYCFRMHHDPAVADPMCRFPLFYKMNAPSTAST